MRAAFATPQVVPTPTARSVIGRHCSRTGRAGSSLARHFFFVPLQNAEAVLTVHFPACPNDLTLIDDHNNYHEMSTPQIQARLVQKPLGQPETSTCLAQVNCGRQVPSL